MNNENLKLFQQIAHSSEVIAEQVMEVNKQNKDDKAYLTAMNMRDTFSTLYDKLRNDNFNDSDLDLKDIAMLHVGAVVLTEQLEKQANEIEKSLHDYKTVVLPKFKEIMVRVQENSKEDFSKILNEKF